MTKVMLKVKWHGAKPTLEQIRARFGASSGSLDETFGVIASPPDSSIYTVLLDEREANKFTTGPFADTVEGPFPEGQLEPRR